MVLDYFLNKMKLKHTSRVDCSLRHILLFWNMIIELNCLLVLAGFIKLRLRQWAGVLDVLIVCS